MPGLICARHRNWSSSPFGRQEHQDDTEQMKNKLTKRQVMQFDKELRNQRMGYAPGSNGGEPVLTLGLPSYTNDKQVKQLRNHVPPFMTMPPLLKRSLHHGTLNRNSRKESLALKRSKLCKVIKNGGLDHHSCIANYEAVEILRRNKNKLDKPSTRSPSSQNSDLRLRAAHSLVASSQSTMDMSQKGVLGKGDKLKCAVNTEHTYNGVVGLSTRKHGFNSCQEGKIQQLPNCLVRNGGDKAALCLCPIGTSAEPVSQRVAGISTYDINCHLPNSSASQAQCHKQMPRNDYHVLQGHVNHLREQKPPQKITNKNSDIINMVYATIDPARANGSQCSDSKSHSAELSRRVKHSRKFLNLSNENNATLLNHITNCYHIPCSNKAGRNGGENNDILSRLYKSGNCSSPMKLPKQCQLSSSVKREGRESYPVDGGGGEEQSLKSCTMFCHGVLTNGSDVIQGQSLLNLSDEDLSAIIGESEMTFSEEPRTTYSAYNDDYREVSSSCSATQYSVCPPHVVILPCRIQTYHLLSVNEVSTKRSPEIRNDFIENEKCVTENGKHKYYSCQARGAGKSKRQRKFNFVNNVVSPMAVVVSDRTTGTQVKIEQLGTSANALRFTSSGENMASRLRSITGGRRHIPGPGYRQRITFRHRSVAEASRQNIPTFTLQGNGSHDVHRDLNSCHIQCIADRENQDNGKFLLSSTPHRQCPTSRKNQVNRKFLESLMSHRQCLTNKKNQVNRKFLESLMSHRQCLTNRKNQENRKCLANISSHRQSDNPCICLRNCSNELKSLMKDTVSGLRKYAFGGSNGDTEDRPMKAPGVDKEAPLRTMFGSALPGRRQFEERHSCSCHEDVAVCDCMFGAFSEVVDANAQPRSVRALARETSPQHWREHGLACETNVQLQRGYGLACKTNVQPQRGCGLACETNVQPQRGYGLACETNVQPQRGYGLACETNVQPRKGYDLACETNVQPRRRHGLACETNAQHWRKPGLACETTKKPLRAYGLECQTNTAKSVLGQCNKQKQHGATEDDTTSDVSFPLESKIKHSMKTTEDVPEADISSERDFKSRYLTRCTGQRSDETNDKRGYIKDSALSKEPMMRNVSIVDKKKQQKPSCRDCSGFGNGCLEKGLHDLKNRIPKGGKVSLSKHNSRRKRLSQSSDQWKHSNVTCHKSVYELAKLDTQGMTQTHASLQPHSCRQRSPSDTPMNPPCRRKHQQAPPLKTRKSERQTIVNNTLQQGYLKRTWKVVHDVNIGIERASVGTIEQCGYCGSLVDKSKPSYVADKNGDRKVRGRRNQSPSYNEDTSEECENCGNIAGKSNPNLATDNKMDRKDTDRSNLLCSDSDVSVGRYENYGSVAGKSKPNFVTYKNKDRIEYERSNQIPSYSEFYQDPIQHLLGRGQGYSCPDSTRCVIIDHSLTNCSLMSSPPDSQKPTSNCHISGVVNAHSVGDMCAGRLPTHSVSGATQISSTVDCRTGRNQDLILQDFSNSKHTLDKKNGVWNSFEKRALVVPGGGSGMSNVRNVDKTTSVLYDGSSNIGPAFIVQSVVDSERYRRGCHQTRSGQENHNVDASHDKTAVFVSADTSSLFWNMKCQRNTQQRFQMVSKKTRARDKRNYSIELINAGKYSLPAEQGSHKMDKYKRHPRNRRKHPSGDNSGDLAMHEGLSQKEALNGCVQGTNHKDGLRSRFMFESSRSQTTSNSSVISDDDKILVVKCGHGCSTETSSPSQSGTANSVYMAKLVTFSSSLNLSDSACHGRDGAFVDPVNRREDEHCLSSSSASDVAGCSGQASNTLLLCCPLETGYERRLVSRETISLRRQSECSVMVDRLSEISTKTPFSQKLQLTPFSPETTPVPFSRSSVDPENRVTHDCIAQVMPNSPLKYCTEETEGLSDASSPTCMNVSDLPISSEQSESTFRIVSTPDLPRISFHPETRSHAHPQPKADGRSVKELVATKQSEAVRVKDIVRSYQSEWLKVKSKAMRTQLKGLNVKYKVRKNQTEGIQVKNNVMRNQSKERLAVRDIIRIDPNDRLKFTGDIMRNQPEDTSNITDNIMRNQPEDTSNVTDDIMKNPQEDASNVTDDIMRNQLEATTNVEDDIMRNQPQHGFWNTQAADNPSTDYSESREPRKRLTNTRMRINDATSAPSIPLHGESVSYMQICSKNGAFHGFRLSQLDDYPFTNKLRPGDSKSPKIVKRRSSSRAQIMKTGHLKSQQTLRTIDSIGTQILKTTDSVGTSILKMPNTIDTNVRKTPDTIGTKFFKTSDSHSKITKNLCIPRSDSTQILKRSHSKNAHKHLKYSEGRSTGEKKSLSPSISQFGNKDLTRERCSPSISPESCEDVSRDNSFTTHWLTDHEGGQRKLLPQSQSQEKIVLAQCTQKSSDNLDKANRINRHFSKDDFKTSSLGSCGGQARSQTDAIQRNSARRDFQRKPAGRKTVKESSIYLKKNANLQYSCGHCIIDEGEQKKTKIGRKLLCDNTLSIIPPSSSTKLKANNHRLLTNFERGKQTRNVRKCSMKHQSDGMSRPTKWPSRKSDKMAKLVAGDILASRNGPNMSGEVRKGGFNFKSSSASGRDLHERFITEDACRGTLQDVASVPKRENLNHTGGGNCPKVSPNSVFVSTVFYGDPRSTSSPPVCNATPARQHSQDTDGEMNSLATTIMNPHKLTDITNLQVARSHKDWELLQESIFSKPQNISSFSAKRKAKAEKAQSKRHFTTDRHKPKSGHNQPNNQYESTKSGKSSCLHRHKLVPTCKSGTLQSGLHSKKSDNIAQNIDKGYFMGRSACEEEKDEEDEDKSVRIIKEPINVIKVDPHLMCQRPGVDLFGQVKQVCTSCTSERQRRSDEKLRQDPLQQMCTKNTATLISPERAYMLSNLPAAPPQNKVRSRSIPKTLSPVVSEATCPKKRSPNVSPHLPYSKPTVHNAETKHALSGRSATTRQQYQGLPQAATHQKRSPNLSPDLPYSRLRPNKAETRKVLPGSFAAIIRYSGLSEAANLKERSPNLLQDLSYSKLRADKVDTRKVLPGSSAIKRQPYTKWSGTKWLKSYPNWRAPESRQYSPRKSSQICFHDVLASNTANPLDTNITGGTNSRILYSSDSSRDTWHQMSHQLSDLDFSHQIHGNLMHVGSAKENKESKVVGDTDREKQFCKPTVDDSCINFKLLSSSVFQNRKCRSNKFPWKLQRSVHAANKGVTATCSVARQRYLKRRLPSARDNSQNLRTPGHRTQNEIKGEQNRSLRSHGLTKRQNFQDVLKRRAQFISIKDSEKLSANIPQSSTKQNKSSGNGVKDVKKNLLSFGMLQFEPDVSKGESFSDCLMPDRTISPSLFLRLVNMDASCQMGSQVFSVAKGNTVSSKDEWDNQNDSRHINNSFGSTERCNQQKKEITNVLLEDVHQKLQCDGKKSLEDKGSPVKNTPELAKPSYDTTSYTDIVNPPAIQETTSSYGDISYTAFIHKVNRQAIKDRAHYSDDTLADMPLINSPKQTGCFLKRRFNRNDDITTEDSSMFYNTTDDVSASVIFDNNSPDVSNPRGKSAYVRKKGNIYLRQEQYRKK